MATHNPYKCLCCLSSYAGILHGQKPLPRDSFCRLQSSTVVAEHYHCSLQYKSLSKFPCLLVDNEEDETPCTESTIYSKVSPKKPNTLKFLLHNFTSILRNFRTVPTEIV